jgi:hypothetical protein
VTIGYPDLRMIELRPLIEHWKSDPGGTYQTWFLWKNRLRNFGAIRRGLGLVVREVHSKSRSSKEPITLFCGSRSYGFQISTSRGRTSSRLVPFSIHAAVVAPSPSCLRRFTASMDTASKALDPLRRICCTSFIPLTFPRLTRLSSKATTP